MIGTWYQTRQAQAEAVGWGRCAGRAALEPRPISGEQPRAWPGIQAEAGAKVNLVGDPVKLLESRANTHSGHMAKTLLEAGSTMS